MKPGPNYKMSKEGKINLAVNWHKPDLASRRRSIAQSEMASRVQPRNRKEKN